MTFGYEAPLQNDIAITVATGWPTLTTAEFRAVRRIPEQYSEQALADSLARSSEEVRQQIMAFSLRQSVPFLVGDTVQFDEPQLRIYRGAVYARSHADLLGYFAAVDMKEAGNNKAQDDEQQDILLAQSNRGVRLLLGHGRCGVHSL
ncbi:head completion/stabilization protein [Shewanella marina]|uniref:head completion/stabilization protein n=1 Tax=Shewanella marina TaxID=487319 RepID=UPI00046EBF67|nr:head completion/stabilization protein [Shewanella marina]